MAQSLLAQVFCPGEVIDDLLLTRIEHQGVDREVAPRGGFFGCDVGIDLDFKALVADAGLVVAPRNCKVVINSAAGGELDDAEGFADQIGTAPFLQSRRQLVVGDAEAFDVVVLDGNAEQRIANAASDEVRLGKGRGVGQDVAEFFRYFDLVGQGGPFLSDEINLRHSVDCRR